MVDHVQSTRTSHQAQARSQPRAEASFATADSTTPKFTISGLSGPHRTGVCPWTEQRGSSCQDAHFRLSTHPLLVDQARATVGQYMNPPHPARVLGIDEKSQIQALSRNQPLLPMLPGQAEPRTHDYQRHGTTSLFAALEIATGSVIGKCWPRPRALEFRKFLQHIDRALP